MFSNHQNIITSVLSVLICLACFSATAKEQPSHTSRNKPPKTTKITTWQKFSFNVGTSDSAQLDWNIASDITGTATPNVLSELTYRDLDIFSQSLEYQLGTQIDSKRGVFFEIYASDGRVRSGTVQDSDYLGDNRTSEFSRSYSDADDSEIKQLNANFGLYVDIHPRIRFSQRIGYSHQEQNFVMTNGRQIIDTINNTSGAFDGLHSLYYARWYGPWIGLSIESPNETQFTWQVKTNYHFANYDASANWNLRTDFAHPESFAHEAKDAVGWVLQGQIGYRIHSHTWLLLTARHEDWSSEDGIDYVYFDGVSTAVTTKLNGSNWEITSYHLGFQFYFTNFL